jgi:hypothetical protein
MVYPPNVSTELDRALYLVERTIRDGLVHGHSECFIRSELIGGGKRRLTVTAGKSHQFVIPPNDLKESASE